MFLNKPIRILLDRIRRNTKPVKDWADELVSVRLVYTVRKNSAKIEISTNIHLWGGVKVIYR